ncbi:hypothetical protein GA0074696_5405 [Micromonospora purpureochromogenes]|uniref:Carrier domain-containing protein n=1 Tax=Micromonospora purpureochromogenes TaxID=47872 RepID=A0A1C5A5Q3_9ACTN|nr:hypothetical protein GA0074696_5405 [Micromonospora purpureochromogenes]
MAVFTLPRRQRPHPTDEEILRDLIWAHTQPPEQVEHVRVRAGPEQIRVTLFVLGADSLAAVQVAEAIRRRISALPAFRD